MNRQASADPDLVRFVLVEPHFAGNVGAAARALKNLGFTNLKLVRPKCDPTGPEARMLAVDAVDLLAAASIHDDLDGAVADAASVVGTTRRTGKHRSPHYRLDIWSDELATLARHGSLAIVFGREAHGLTDRELDRCTQLVSLPAHHDYPVYNLAQSVLLVAWELRRATGMPGVSAAAKPDAQLAPHAEREAFFGHMQEALETIGYLHDDSVEPIMRRLRRLLGRAQLTDDDVRLLRGMARQILWAAEKAGLRK